MAKKATKAGGGAKAKKADSKPKGRAVARVSSSRGGSKGDNGFNAGDAFIKLLQSPLVAELVAVAATAALASLAEHGKTVELRLDARMRRAREVAHQAAALSSGIK